MPKTMMKANAGATDFAHLIARKDGVLCTVCGAIEPVGPGESGTPIPSLVLGYEGCKRRHPRRPHKNLWKDA